MIAKSLVRDVTRTFGQSRDLNTMFCSNCGEKATGRFCAYCGSPVALASSGLESTDGLDWKDECRYQVLLHFPEVRDLIAQATPPAAKGLTGEDFLKICETFARPLTGLPISPSKLSSVVVPIYARLGIESAATRKRGSERAHRENVGGRRLLAVAPGSVAQASPSGRNRMRDRSISSARLAIVRRSDCAVLRAPTSRHSGRRCRKDSRAEI